MKCRICKQTIEEGAKRCNYCRSPQTGWGIVTEFVDKWGFKLFPIMIAMVTTLTAVDEHREKIVASEKFEIAVEERKRIEIDKEASETAFQTLFEANPEATREAIHQSLHIRPGDGHLERHVTKAQIEKKFNAVEQKIVSLERSPNLDNERERLIELKSQKVLLESIRER